LPIYTEKEVLRYLQRQEERGETTQLKYLYCLLPKSITYLRRISRLNRSDERRHVKLLKERFREMIEMLSQFKLIKTQEESRVKLLAITDLGFKFLKNPDSTLKHKKIFFTSQRLLIPAQSAFKSLKFKSKIASRSIVIFLSKFCILLLVAAVLIGSGYFLWLFYSHLFVFIFESDYKLSISVLIEHQPWLSLYIQSFSVMFAVLSLIVFFKIIKAYSRKLNRKKLGVVKGESKWKIILYKIWHGFPSFSLNKFKKNNKRPNVKISSKPRKGTLKSIKKNLYWIPLLGAPLYFLIYLVVLSSFILYYRAYYMLPLDYPLPIEYVYQTFPFMELISHMIGLLISAILTTIVAYIFNRFKKINS